MKKIVLFAVFAIISNYCVYAEKIPKFYFDFGTKRSDIVFKLGESKYPLAGRLFYETYTRIKTLESTTFYMDEDKKLVGISMDIGVDYSPTIPRKEFLQKAYEHYIKIFKNIYGKPYIENKVGFAWKFDDGFASFAPYNHKKNGDLRFKFICFPKEYAKDTQYESLYKSYKSKKPLNVDPLPPPMLRSKPLKKKIEKFEKKP